MSVTVLNSLLLLIEAALYFGVMATLLRLRHQMGVGLFMSALGVMHFIETYLAGSFYVELPFGIVSPGSTVLFSGKLMMLLLLYMKEDATTVRQPIYGLLIGNFLVLALVGVLGFHQVAQLANDRTPDIGFVQEMGWLMVWGTVLLYIDALAIILCYEKLGRWFGTALLPRIVISAAAVLTFDQVGFYLVLRFMTDAPISVFYGGWFAKMAAAIVYSFAMLAYLKWVERQAPADPRRISDLFDLLTYREKYEKLMDHSARDGLTGLFHRGHFETTGAAEVEKSLASGRPLTLLVLDIDHFKSINDRFGHVEGDRAIRTVAALLAGSVGGDGRQAFRVGGDEFALLLPLPHSVGWLLAENLRQTIAASEEGMRFDLTVSIGVATVSDQTATLHALYAAADRCLYKAKGAGRDRVVGELLSTNRPMNESLAG